MASPLDREAIMVALYSLLLAAYPWATFGRRLEAWSTVSATPAMFLRHIGDKYLTTSSMTQHRPTGLPPMIYVDAEVWLYNDIGVAPGQIPETAINQLIDVIEGALHPGPMASTQTLDGLVRHCWIDGDITIDPGTDIDGKAIAIVPVRMLVVGRTSAGIAPP